jgi:hypothetical protein
MEIRATPKQVELLKREYGDAWWCPLGLGHRLMTDDAFAEEWLKAGLPMLED